MTAQKLTFSKALHFSGLDADPGCPQPATLVWEIENDPTLLAATIDVRFGEIAVSTAPDTGQGASPDLSVVFELRKAGTPIAWGELLPAEQAALLAVLAAHEGKPTTSAEQAVLANPETVAPASSTWVDKATIDTSPMRAGKYRLIATGEHYLQNTPGTLGVQRSQVRIALDTGGGETTRAIDETIVEFSSSFYLVATYNAREGETITAKLQHKAIGAAAASCLRRARLAVHYIEGNEAEV